MSFNPFDTGLIAERLRATVPALQVVGNAADYAAVKELRGFRTPSAFVVFDEDSNSLRVPDSIGVCAQEAQVRFGVVLALRNYGDKAGERLVADSRGLVGQVRAALIGHKPPGTSARVIGWRAGKVLDYDASVLLFADAYELVYTMSREAAPCHAHNMPGG